MRAAGTGERCKGHAWDFFTDGLLAESVVRGLCNGLLAVSALVFFDRGAGAAALGVAQRTAATVLDLDPLVLTTRVEAFLTSFRADDLVEDWTLLDVLWAAAFVHFGDNLVVLHLNGSFVAFEREFLGTLRLRAVGFALERVALQVYVDHRDAGLALLALGLAGRQGDAFPPDAAAFVFATGWLSATASLHALGDLAWRRLAFAGNPFKTLGDGAFFQNHLAFGAGAAFFCLWIVLFNVFGAIGADQFGVVAFSVRLVGFHEEAFAPGADWTFPCDWVADEGVHVFVHVAFALVRQFARLQLALERTFLLRTLVRYVYVDFFLGYFLSWFSCWLSWLGCCWFDFGLGFHLEDFDLVFDLDDNLVSLEDGDGTHAFHLLQRLLELLRLHLLDDVLRRQFV